MTNVALVLAKLTTLRDHLGRIERRRPADVQSLRGDLDRQDALALSVLVALQEAADIALHMASDEGWGVDRSVIAGPFPSGSSAWPHSSTRVRAD